MTTLSAGESASRSERHRDDKPKGFFARALAHLFFRKNAVLANHTFEDTSAGIKEVYRVVRQDSYRAQQQALSRKLSSHTGPESSKARSEPVLEDDARFESAVRHEVTIPMPLESRNARSEPVLEDDARFASAVRHEVTISMPLGSR